LGDANDLNKSIEHKLRACNIAPAGLLDLPQLLCSLGASYNRRYIDEENSRIDDIDKAIQYQEQAKALVPKGHPDFHRWLSRLGSSYHNRARHSNEVGDLNKAIENMLQAHSLTPGSDPSLVWQLSNIGAFFYARYEQVGEMDDLNQAIEYHERAYEATPDQHPDITLILHYLGICYQKKFQLLSEQDCLNKALDYFRQGTFSAGYPVSRLEAALDWARLCAESGVSNQLHGYQAAIELIPEVIWVGVTVDERYRILGRMIGIATEAASAAIASSQLELAIEWLEQGRSVVWNQILLLQSPLDELRERFPNLADKLQELANELYHTSARSDFESRENTKNLPTPDQVARRHHELARDYTDHISHIRELPGLSNFLKPKKASDFVCAARVGPVVMINCHENRCDAIIISPGGLSIQHAPLPSFTNKDARELRVGLERLLGGDNMRQRGILLRPRPTKRHIQFKSILATLWRKVAKPILEVLQYKVCRCS
jgi:tetratricopeptide (TPR) repeat protein